MGEQGGIHRRRAAPNLNAKAQHWDQRQNSPRSPAANRPQAAAPPTLPTGTRTGTGRGPLARPHPRRPQGAAAAPDNGVGAIVCGGGGRAACSPPTLPPALPHRRIWAAAVQLPPPAAAPHCPVNGTRAGDNSTPGRRHPAFAQARPAPTCLSRVRCQMGFSYHFVETLQSGEQLQPSEVEGHLMAAPLRRLPRCTPTRTQEGTRASSRPATHQTAGGQGTAQSTARGRSPGTGAEGSRRNRRAAPMGQRPPAPPKAGRTRGQR